MANLLKKNESQPKDPPSSPLPETSLSWCLTQLNKSAHLVRSSSPSGETSPPSREADKWLKAKQWKALVAIRTHHIKGGGGRIVRYQAQGGLPPLLAILHRPESSRKILDLTLSILANCCTERETRAEVRKLGGVSIVVEVLKRHSSAETVENRAARTLGNLAMDTEGSAQVHSAGGVAPLLLCLSLSGSPSSPSSPSAVASPSPSSSTKLECAQSAARALFYLSDTPTNRLSLLSQGALPALALFLAPDFPPSLRRASLRALHELTRGCGVECARDVSGSGVLSQLGLLVSEDEDENLEELALKTLANLCSQGCLRPLVGSLGVIPKFAEEVKKDPLKAGVLFRALCLCCKEAVNRVKVKESGGLEVLTGFLAAHPSHPLTRLAVLACVDFVYDEAALEQLQELGLVPLLVVRLVELTKGDELQDSPCSELTSCFESFDFPHPEGGRREEVGKEQGSSSFLSLRSWLLSEGLISSEGELMESPCGADGDLGSLHPSFSPSYSSSSSSSPPLSVFSDISSSSSSSSVLLNPSSSPSARLKPCRLSSSASPSHCSVLSPCPSSPSSLLSTCISTPQSKPAVPSASPFKASSPPRKRPRTVSSSSNLSLLSLDVPPAVPKTPAYLHPYHPEPWAPESPILLLLSRFSHATDPSGALVTAPVFSALLYYLTQHREPSSRCCRMLTRISCNLNCLQALVRTGAVALIRHRLCHGEEDKEGKERQSVRVKSKIKQLGVGVLNNVRVQSETGFGSGVLSHIVLSGSESDKLFCVLSLPLITSNRVLLKKLLLDSGGLLAALDPLVGLADGEHKKMDKCSSVLSAWLCPLEQASVCKVHTLYISLLIGCLSSLLSGSKVRPQNQPSDVTKTADQGEVSSAICACPYRDSNHDLNFVLDDGTLLPANRDLVSGEAGHMGVESEYFRALLRGEFDEARRSEKDVRIGDVSVGALLPVLHYLHGCRMACSSGDDAPCPVFSSLAHLGDHSSFHQSSLAELMVGASRFLVSGLQRTAEDLCISLLSSLASKTSAYERFPETNDSKPHTSQRTCDLPDIADKNALSSTLPQVYQFSQRYSYSRLAAACLSILLRPQEAACFPLPMSVSADCLLRLVRDADSTENLRKDLLSLASAALV